MIKQLILSYLHRNGYDLVRRDRVGPGTATVTKAIHYPPTAWLDPYPIRTILDIGANAGDFALTMAGRFPHARIISFEPLAGPYAELARKTADEPRCTAIRCAVGESESTIEMRPCTYSPSSSLLPMTDVHREAFPFTAGEESPEVIRVRRLDDIAAETALEDEMLVKIDVQGFEGHVIRGGMATLRRARGIIVETSFAPLYEGQPSFDDVYRALCGLGFTYAGNWDQLPDARTGKILQADAIFLRST